ncbi:MAG: LysM peptidoglycan-binding domain-containing protein, partial [Geminicoccaceae bacterium]
MSALLLSACTNYRPLDKGARVPWAKALAAAKGGPLDGNRYRVEQGDALNQIASSYNVRLTSLAQANNIPPPYVLYPGEVLRIPTVAAQPARSLEVRETPLRPSAPLVQPSKSVARFEAAPRQVVKAPQQTPQTTVARAKPKPPEPVIVGKRHVVAAGENLALIAERNGLRLSELVAANKVQEPYRIKPGQVLVIPRKETSVARRSEPVRQENASSGSAISPSPPLSDEGFMWPVHGSLIGNFDQVGSGGRSGGVNIAIRKGAPVRASENGIVAYAGEALSGYGRLVMLRHAEGYVTLYAHNDV